MITSFVRESQRMHPVQATLGARKVLSGGGYTFKNGDHAPQNSLVAVSSLLPGLTQVYEFQVKTQSNLDSQLQVPAYAAQRDPAYYSDPEKFDGFRFAERPSKKAITASSDDHQAFGYGRHACAGWKFALVIVKLIFVRLILEYDFEELPVRPKDKPKGQYQLPDTETTIRLRKI